MKEAIIMTIVTFLLMTVFSQPQKTCPLTYEQAEQLIEEAKNISHHQYVLDSITCPQEGMEVIHFTRWYMEGQDTIFTNDSIIVYE